MTENDCEHEETDPDTLKCKACDLQFVVCRACTKVVGTWRNVLHTAPPCHEDHDCDAGDRQNPQDSPE